MTPTALEARGLTHRYGSDEVLGGVDLTLTPGECVAMIGPNGAGKTTLLRCLAGTLEPSEGAAMLDGVGLHDMRSNDIARRVSVVPQAHPPVFGFTVLEFVLMGFHAQMGRFALESHGQRQRALEALATMGVEPFASRSLTTLSGGEAQRVVMARTLVSGATYWLLDEPTANLDLSHQVSLLDTVRRHCDDGGAALAILHDLNLVERTFDRVVILSEGRVVADDSPRAALNPELLRDVFNVELRPTNVDGRVVWSVP